MTDGQPRRTRSGIGCAAGIGALVAFVFCGAGVGSATYGDWATGVDQNGWWMKLQVPTSYYAGQIVCTMWFSPGSSTTQVPVDQNGVALFDHIPLNDPTKNGAGTTCSVPGSPEGFQVPMRHVGSTEVGTIAGFCSTPPCPPPIVWTTP
jgi:hypothetical protein